MSGADIASYLSMRAETVSRGLSKLEACGFLRIHRNWIEITDEVALKRIAAGTGLY